MTDERKYIQGATVANVSISIALYRPYMVGEEKKFELISNERDRFTSRVSEDDPDKALEKIKTKIEGCKQNFNQIKATPSGIL